MRKGRSTGVALPDDELQAARSLSGELRSSGVPDDMIDEAAGKIMVKAGVLIRTKEGKLRSGKRSKAFCSQLDPADLVKRFLSSRDGRKFVQR